MTYDQYKQETPIPTQLHCERCGDEIPDEDVQSIPGEGRYDYEIVCPECARKEVERAYALQDLYEDYEDYQ